MSFEDFYEAKQPLLIGTFRFKKVDTLPVSPPSDYILYWHNTDETFYFWDKDLGAFIDVSNAGGSYLLGDLSDINLGTLSNGEILQYNSTSQKWENATAPSGGGSAPTRVYLNTIPSGGATTILGSYGPAHRMWPSSGSVTGFGGIIPAGFDVTKATKLKVMYIWESDEATSRLFKLFLSSFALGEKANSDNIVNNQDITFASGLYYDISVAEYDIIANTFAVGDKVSGRIDRNSVAGESLAILKDIIWLETVP